MQDPSWREIPFGTAITSRIARRIAARPAIAHRYYRPRRTAALGFVLRILGQLPLATNESPLDCWPGQSPADYDVSMTPPRSQPLAPPSSPFSRRELIVVAVVLLFGVALRLFSFSRSAV